MSDDDFDEAGEFEGDEPEDFEEDELEEVLDDDDEELLEDEEIAVGLEVITEDDDDDASDSGDDDEDVVDLDEELHPDDVEEALDVVLRERTAKVGLDDEEEDDEPDDRGGEGTKIVPRRPGEFLCKSCFLVLPRHQLADEERELCHDCA